MKISSINNEFAKTAFSSPSGELPLEGDVVDGRNNRSIADALANAGKGMGLSTMITNSGGAYVVTCNGRAGEDGNPIVQFIYKVYPVGDMQGYIMRGMEKGDGALRVFRQIVANAVKESNIAAIPGPAEYDPPLCMNPNHYADLAARYTAGEEIPGANIP